jgi:type IV secretion system protein VirB8
MNEYRHIEPEDYYSQAGSWNQDRVGAIKSSQRIAWWVAAVAAAIALFEATALMLLTPLKTIEPLTLMVDRTTGYVEALKPLDATTVSPDSALTQSFLVQYVIAREGFDITTFPTSYRKVALFSADEARRSYLETAQASNPQSPLELYPRSSRLDVRVKSVSPIGSNTALVRFDTVRIDAGARQQPTDSWVAIIRYRYSRQPMSLEDRFVNPLGFQVTSYHKDAEARTAAEASAPSPAVAAAAPSEHLYDPQSTQEAPQQAGADQ